MAQCSSCQFHNMPGATHCSRCQASLTLATAVIDVHPPRASRSARLWRKSIPGRFWRGRADAWSRVARRINLEPEANLPSIPVLLRLVLPGWPQWYRGRWQLGLGLMGSFAVCMLLAMVVLGTFFSTMLIALAIVIHAASIFDVAQQSTQSRGGRISRFLLGYALVGTIVYLPLYSLMQQVASPLVVRWNRPPLQDGDVYLVASKQVRAPRIGDVVVYDMARGRMTNDMVQYILRGQRIDRILAGPGQSVVWDGGKLTVDGQPSTLQPLNVGKPLVRLAFDIPPGHYFVIPSTEIEGPRGVGTADANQWRLWSIVSADDIQGRVYWQTWPVLRMGPVR